MDSYLLSNLFIFAVSSYTSHYINSVVDFFFSEILVRSFFSIRFFNNITYSHVNSGRYLINLSFFNKKTILNNFKARSKSYSRSFFSNNISNFFPASIHSFFFGSQSDLKLNLNSSNFSKYNEKLKSLPSFLYSFYWRFFSNISFSKYFLNVNFFRKFFILHSSFAFIYKRFFDSFYSKDQILSSFFYSNSIHSSLFRFFFNKKKTLYFLSSARLLNRGEIDAGFYKRRNQKRFDKKKQKNLDYFFSKKYQKRFYVNKKNEIKMIEPQYFTKHNDKDNRLFSFELFKNIGYRNVVYDDIVQDNAVAFKIRKSYKTDNIR